MCPLPIIHSSFLQGDTVRSSGLQIGHLLSPSHEEPPRVTARGGVHSPAHQSGSHLPRSRGTDQMTPQTLPSKETRLRRGTAGVSHRQALLEDPHITPACQPLRGLFGGAL